ncbi:MAG TPA: hypothetical protein VFN42_02415 [Acetobacteraceae bacterium]|nr:hypothetical protein [Acetobacteraceae bacterium]
MQRFFVSACLLGSLAGCTAAPPPPPVVAHVSPPGEAGIVLAIHPVPAAQSGPAELVLARLGGGPGLAGNAEFVVRRADGAVFAVVQPRVQQDAATLRPGSRVLILPGIPTRLRALPALAAR